MTRIVTPADETKKWTDALKTIFEDLVHRFEPTERRIILEGLAFIYLRFEDISEKEHKARHRDETAGEACNLVQLAAYMHRKQGGNTSCPE